MGYCIGFWAPFTDMPCMHEVPTLGGPKRPFQAGQGTVNGQQNSS